MSREEFLARVRAAAHAGRAYRVHVDDVDPAKGYVGARCDDLCESMAAEVKSADSRTSLPTGKRLASKCSTCWLNIRRNVCCCGSMK